MIKVLKDKRGNSTLIYSVVILLFLCLVTIFVIGSNEFRTLTLNISNTSKTALEEYINTETINEINSLKNGTDYNFEIDEDEYKTYLANALNIGEDLTGTTGNGRTFEITNISITNNNDLDLTLTLTLSMPFKITENYVINFDKEITITSKLTSTFS
ncbi:MAG: hypothetical protein R3Y35_14525 [Clostridia bacterium]